MAPGLDARAGLGELRERIGEELDYELEAQHQRRLARAGATIRTSSSRASTRRCPPAASS
jgi:predicted unusual protein kinase regulating ubiquinone biosynthesis (AarF/ABC1/UbiB family)